MTATPASGQAIHEALRACAGAGDREAALRVRIAAPATGRVEGLLDAFEDSQRPVGERRCAALGLKLWPAGDGDVEAAERLAAIAMEAMDEDLAGDAADALAASGAAMAVQTLLAVAGRDEIKVRRRAALALATMNGAAGAAEALRTLSGEGAPRLVEAALRGLAGVGGPADVEVFQAHLHDADPLVRQRAIEGVGRHGDAAALDDLVAALGDRYQPIAVAAAGGLGRLKSAEAVEALGAYLSGPERAAADAAMVALGAIGDPAGVRHVTPYLFDRDGYLRVSAARALDSIGDPSALAHLDRALDTELVNARVAVLGAIASFGAKAGMLRSKIRRIGREQDLHPRVAEAVEEALRTM